MKAERQSDTQWLYKVFRKTFPDVTKKMLKFWAGESPVFGGAMQGLKIPAEEASVSGGGGEDFPRRVEGERSECPITHGGERP